MIQLPRNVTTSILALLTAFAAPAFAGDTTVMSDKQPTMQQAAQEANTQNLLYLDSNYDFASGFHKGNFGAQAATDSTVEIGHRFLLNSSAWPNEGGQWFFRLGATYNRSDFSSTRAPTPDVLQNFNGEVALEYMVDNNQALFIQSHPGFYFSKHVTASAFDMPTDIAGGFTIIHDKVYGFLGITGSILRTSTPVLPIGGILWNIDPKWVLRAIVPQPRLIYNATSNLALWTGGELSGGSYKTDGNSELTPERLSGAIVNYYEVRAGGGVTYNLKPVTIEAASGWVFERDFDYPRADLNYSTRGAPYIRLSAHLDF